MGGRTVRFTIPGPPKGKARARTLKSGISYTPKDTVVYEKMVRECFRAEAGPDWIIHEGPVQLTIGARFPVPRATSKRKRELMLVGEISPTKKPDWDNIGKIVSDALNKVAYHDDSQIIYCELSKVYRDTPGVYVELYFEEGIQ